MKQEIKDRWTTALRSGEYEQTTNDFESRDGGKFCALGVLCDAMGQPTRIAGTFQGNWDFAYSLLETEQVWAVVDRNDGSLTDDGLPMPFPRLADWIDENIPVT